MARSVRDGDAPWRGAITGGILRGRFHEDQSPTRATTAAFDPAPDLHLSGSLRGRAGARQAHHRHRRLQPLEALRPADAGRQAPDQEVERPPAGADGLGQDAHRADAGAVSRRAVYSRRRHRVHRGRLLREGRRGDGGRAPAPGRPGRGAGAARDRLHRRDRQDRPPQPGRAHRRRHARHRRRGGPAGAAEGARGARDLRAAQRDPALEQARLRGARHPGRPLHRGGDVLGPPAHRSRASRSASAPVAPPARRRRRAAG